MKNLFEHTNAFWAKYAAYEWRVAPDGKEYLLPTKDAEAAVYNIMKVADQLVLDAVNIGLLVIHKSPEKEIKAAIHTFVCNYGLLGMMLPFLPRQISWNTKRSIFRKSSSFGRKPWTH